MGESVGRMIKTGKEISYLKKAARVSDSCIPIIKKSLREGVTEKELRRRVEKNIKNQGCRISFGTLVASGRRSTMVHAKPRATNRKIEGVGYIDFGASYKGYKSDVTVPFIVRKVGRREMKVVKAVVAAHDVAMRSIKIGEPCWKVHEVTNTFLRSRGFRMIHAMGHGLGKNIHELPYIGKPRKKLRGLKKRKWEKLKKIVFQKGMVFTIEPAVYTKNFGCRLENDVLMTRHGKKILTHAKLIGV